jgi:hypothetical protein
LPRSRILRCYYYQGGCWECAHRRFVKSCICGVRPGHLLPLQRRRLFGKKSFLWWRSVRFHSKEERKKIQIMFVPNKQSRSLNPSCHVHRSETSGAPTATVGSLQSGALDLSSRAGGPRTLPLPPPIHPPPSACLAVAVFGSSRTKAHVAPT